MEMKWNLWNKWIKLYRNIMKGSWFFFTKILLDFKRKNVNIQKVPWIELLLFSFISGNMITYYIYYHECSKYIPLFLHSVCLREEK